MALPHAQPLDVIALHPLGEALVETPSTSLIKTERLQLLHVVLMAHEQQPLHRLDDECTVHCLEGTVELTMDGGTRRLNAGELVLVPARTAHGLQARSDAALLVTLLLREGDAAAQGAVNRGKP
jgi:quercetin dioxygenase-like cupin family protein